MYIYYLILSVNSYDNVWELLDLNQSQATEQPEHLFSHGTHDESTTYCL